MTRHLLLSLTLCFSLSGALSAVFAADPAPAVIRTMPDGNGKSNAFEKAFIVHESVDGIDFTVDDPRSANTLNLKYGTYTVEYGDPVNIDFMKARAQEESNQFDKALESYQRATVAAKLEWVKEDSQLHGAQLALKLKKHDEALALIAGLEKDNPRSVRLAKALLIRGQTQAAKGDSAGAGKTFAALSTMAKEWGTDAAIFGAVGQADLLSVDKKYSEAADILSKLLTRVDAGKNRDEIGGLALALATAQNNGGKAADALVTVQAYVWKDIEATQQAQLHLLWGTILAQKGDTASLTAGFDQAALAATKRGAEASVIAAAKVLALSINNKLSKDPAVTAPNKAEFKRMLGLF